MTNSDRLKHHLRKIYALANLQRAMRLMLRSFWLSAAGVMLGWGANKLWGWLPNPLSWLLIGLLFALFPIGAILTNFTFPLNWIRKMDQSLGMRGQLSTAWEIAHRPARRTTQKADDKEQNDTVEDLLIADALTIVPQVRKQALQPGLYHDIDLAATIILTVLACTLLASLLIKPQPEKSITSNPMIPLTAPTPTPDQGQGQPTPDPQQSAGQSPQQSGPSGAQSQGQQAQAGNDQAGNTSSGGNQSAGNSGDTRNPDMSGLSDELRQMGAQLSKQAGTYSLGQSLENMDLNGAAKALEDLSSQVSNLSPESLNNLAQAMQNAANDVGQTSNQSLANDLGSAASALSGTNDQTSGALGQVANDLRQLNNGMQAAGGTGSSAGNGKSSQTGNPEPLSRLSNENGTFSLPVDGSPQSGLLSPAQPGSAGTDTASGSLDSTYQPGENIIQAPILPNTFSWKWRNVVSQYFQR